MKRHWTGRVFGWATYKIIFYQRLQPFSLIDHYCFLVSQDDLKFKLQLHVNEYFQYFVWQNYNFEIGPPKDQHSQILFILQWFQERIGKCMTYSWWKLKGNRHQIKKTHDKSSHGHWLCKLKYHFFCWFSLIIET
jgi:hypothetical protein